MQLIDVLDRIRLTPKDHTVALRGRIFWVVLSQALRARLHRIVPLGLFKTFNQALAREENLKFERDFAETRAK